ncbi:androgen-dependent TFPI-regulating protein-like [Amphibalanus amphitrite]|uniref:androgen-dependent TFPI-regulating protein-like n=1 Tax=Amphibalanus amphitrite TaxID=1232801 RepID=UPI001C91A643|nr:androgen-dependent TFPI-regulating protein-like [Amphibalanus amphitrite]
MGLLLHLVGIAVFGGCTYYETYHLLENAKLVQDHPVVKELFSVRPQWGGRWKFLTVWGLTVQLVYNILAAINDVFGTSTVVYSATSRLQRLRDVFFTALSLPIAMVVCILFWGMYAISRELVFPEVMDLFYPSALNHGVHTAPVLLALLELVLVPHHFSSHHVSLALLVLFLGAYLAWTMYLALVAELWVYGVMKVLSWPLRIAFMAANLAFAIGLYLLGKKLDHLVWGKQKADAATADQRRAKKHR